MESKLGDMIKTSMESIKDIVDVNTVVGEPINAPAGVTIIPVSRVSVGYASGGLDYLGKQPAAVKGVKNFGGGGGTGITVTPVAFIVIKSNGSVELLNVDAPTGAKSNTVAGNVMDIMDKSPDFIEKMKTAFIGNKNKNKEKTVIPDDAEKDKE